MRRRSKKRKSTVFSVFRQTHQEVVPVFEEFFELDELIGQGAFGSVWRAFKKGNKAGKVKVPYAVKALSKNFMDAADYTMVEDEIAVLSDLRHPYIISFKGKFESPDYFHIIMEYVVGGDIGSYLEENHRMTESNAKHCFRQIFEALEYCSSKGVAHRDIKPKNILITGDINDDPLIKLIDFGLSAVVDLKVHSNDEKMFEGWVGSLYYVSPEIIKKEKYSFKTDIWSSGVVLFQVLSGVRPFILDRTLAGGREILLQSISRGEYRFEENWVEISDHAKEFVTSLLIVDPEDRPSASAVSQLDWLREEEDPKTMTRRELNAVTNANLTESLRLKRAALGKFEGTIKLASGLSAMYNETKSSREVQVDNLKDITDEDVLLSGTFGRIGF